jgi:hypothetical protein
MSTWIPAVFGLLGTGVGAATTWATTLSAQRKLDRRTAAERIAAQEQTAIDSLARSMWDVIRLTRELPQGVKAVLEWESAAETAWSTALSDILGPATIHVEALHDSERRALIEEVLRLLDDWQTPLHQVRRHPEWILTSLARYVISVLGAYRRNEATPAGPKALEDARDARSLQEEQWEMQRDWEESQAQERREAREANRREQPDT